MSFKRILGAVLAAAFAASIVASPASAHDPNNYKAPGGIFPTLLGPIGAAALFPSTSIFNWTTTLNQKLFFHKFNFYKWGQVIDLHKAGYDINVKKIGHKYVKVKASKTQHHSRSSKTVGKAVVGCIFGSALATITSAMRKATAMGNPPRWRSQAEHEKILASGYEKQFELTLDEANTAMAFCGLGSFALHWPQQP